MKATGGGGESSSTNSAMAQQLYAKYPMSSQWEFTLKNGETFKGEVYCTDPVADLVVIQDALKDIRMISVASISESRQVSEASAEAQQKLALSSAGNVVHAKKALEEREKRAIRIAQDSLKHLNPKVRRTVSIWTIFWNGDSIFRLTENLFRSKPSCFYFNSFGFSGIHQGTDCV
jgi:hypothetical protein